MQQCNKIYLFVILVLTAAATGILPIEDGMAGAGFGIRTSKTVIDQAGREITLEAPFKRVISLYGAHTENLFALGLADEIIGVSRHEDYPPQALEKPVFSYHDDPEKFLAVRPDLVLIRPMIDRGYPKFVRVLEKYGIVVVSLQPGTVDEMFTYWEILGMLTGARHEAQRMISRFQNTVAEFKKLTGPRIEKKQVYFEAIHSKMKTFARQSMAIFALESAGGVNIASDTEPVRNTNIAYYGKERILAHASDIDVYLAQYGAMNRPTVATIKLEPGFYAIKAVATDQIYIVDEKIVSRPTMRLLEGIYVIGKYLYPAIFDDKASKIIGKLQFKGGRY